MNTMIKFIFYAGFLFFGGGFVIAFSQFVIYNGLGNIIILPIIRTISAAS